MKEEEEDDDDDEEEEAAAIRTQWSTKVDILTESSLCRHLVGGKVREGEGQKGVVGGALRGGGQTVLPQR